MTPIETVRSIIAARRRRRLTVHQMTMARMQEHRIQTAQGVAEYMRGRLATLTEKLRHV